MSGKRSKWLLSGLLATALAGALPLTARGQAVPAQQSPLVQARKAVTDANAELAKDKLAVERARQKVELAFGKADPGYATAKRTFEKASLDLRNITTAAMASLQQNPDYIAALKAKQAAKDKQEALKVDDKASEDDRQAAFNDVIAKANVVKDMEAAATVSDPRIADARQRVADAKQAMDDYKAKLDTACAADPEYQQAQAAETASEQRVAQATASMQQQAKQAAAAAAAAAAARSKTPSTPRPGG